MFHEPERRAVLAGWPAGRVDHAVGPARVVPVIGASSGLLTIADGPRIVRTATHRYRQRGVWWRDADPVASKGVLLAELDSGIELYSTHVLAGNDFVKRRDGPHGELSRLRQQQVDELVAFVRTTHRPDNVAMVVGDFNIVADDPVLYGRLRASMDAIGTDDVWAANGQGPGLTFPEGTTGKRIDYAWLERPSPDHRIAVAVDTVETRAFPSDHLAIHLELTVRPR